MGGSSLTLTPTSTIPKPTREPMRSRDLRLVLILRFRRLRLRPACCGVASSRAARRPPKASAGTPASAASGAVTSEGAASAPSDSSGGLSMEIVSTDPGGTAGATLVSLSWAGVPQPGQERAPLMCRRHAEQ
jgi:hypothetical protein